VVTLDRFSSGLLRSEPNLLRISPRSPITHSVSLPMSLPGRPRKRKRVEQSVLVTTGGLDQETIGAVPNRSLTFQRQSGRLTHTLTSTHAEEAIYAEGDEGIDYRDTVNQPIDQDIHFDALYDNPAGPEVEIGEGVEAMVNETENAQAEKVRLFLFASYSVLTRVKRLQSLLSLSGFDTVLAT
jgi:hypothetical protein